MGAARGIASRVKTGSQRGGVVERVRVDALELGRCCRHHAAQERAHSLHNNVQSIVKIHRAFIIKYLELLLPRLVDDLVK